MIGNIRIDQHGRKWRTIGASDDTIIEEPIDPIDDISDVKKDIPKKEHIETEALSLVNRYDSNDDDLSTIYYGTYFLYDKNGMIIKHKRTCNIFDSKV